MKETDFELKRKIYDWLFWLSLFITGLWFTLKIIGVIKTPLWLELMPVASVIFGAGIFFQKVEHIGDDLHDFKLEMHEFRNRTEIKFDEVKAALHKHDNRLIRMEAKLA